MSTDLLMIRHQDPIGTQSTINVPHATAIRLPVQELAKLCQRVCGVAEQWNYGNEKQD